MKCRQSFLIVLFSLSISFITAQVCDLDSGVVYLNSQEEVDQFGIDNPDCTEADRSIFINGDDISDLSALGNLIKVNGTIQIRSCPNLQNLEGLNSIKSIGIDLKIFDCDNLQDISALNQLEIIGKFLEFKNLPSLISTGEFSQLDTIRRRITLQNINALDVNAFSNLDFVEDIYIEENTFPTLSAFPELIGIDDYLVIENNLLLTSINDFPKLKEGVGDLRINGNQALLNIEGFSELDSVKLKFQIQDSPSLSDISSAFTSLRYNETHIIIENTMIESISNFNNLETCGTFILSENPELTSLAGLENLRTVDGEFQLYKNEKLNNIEAIENIDYATLRRKYTGFNSDFLKNDRLFYIYGNTDLDLCQYKLVCDLLKHTYPSQITLAENGESCSDKDQLIYDCSSHYCFSDGLTINSSEEIDSLFADLPICNVIDGDFTIGSNPNTAGNTILYLSDLDFIDTIKGNLIIENSQYEEIRGLNSLRYIDGDIIIRNKN